MGGTISKSVNPSFVFFKWKCAGLAGCMGRRKGPCHEFSNLHWCQVLRFSPGYSPTSHDIIRCCMWYPCMILPFISLCKAYAKSDAWFNTFHVGFNKEIGQGEYGTWQFSPQIYFSYCQTRQHPMVLCAEMPFCHAGRTTIPCFTRGSASHLQQECRNPHPCASNHTICRFPHRQRH